MNPARWFIEKWRQPAIQGGTPVIVDCARVYSLETLARGPVAEAGTLFQDGRPLGWLAWRVDRFGRHVDNGKVKPTLEQALDSLGLEVDDDARS